MRSKLKFQVQADLGVSLLDELLLVLQQVTDSAFVLLMLLCLLLGSFHGQLDISKVGSQLGFLCSAKAFVGICHPWHYHADIHMKVQE